MPTWIADVLHAWREGRLSAALALEAANLCVDCGACQSFCHEGQPLPAAIRAARAELAPPPPAAALARITGEGRVVAVLSDARDWSVALSAKLREPVASLHTTDALGASMLGRPAFRERAAMLRSAVGARRVVVASGDVAAVLKAADVAFEWLHEVLGWSDLRPGCAAVGAGAGCCGGAGPLSAAHPADAARMAARWGAGQAVSDSRCAAHLRGAVGSVEDAVDRLLQTTTGGVP